TGRPREGVAMSVEVADRLPFSLDAIDGYAQTLDASECTLLAQQFASIGAWREVLRLCCRHPARNGARGIRLCEARARFGLGERGSALAIVDQLLGERPEDGLASFYRAQFLAQSGDA